jgi:hypothetical protein
MVKSGMVTVYHGTRGGLGDAGPHGAILKTGILKAPVYVSTDPLVARYFGAYVWRLRVPREWLKVDTYLENYPDIEEETGKSVDFFRGKIFFIDRDLPVRRATWSDMRNVPRNPARAMPWQLTKRQFERSYYQHTDIRSKTLEEALRVSSHILKDGFHPGYVNVIPATTSMPPANVIDMRWGTKAGKVTYAIPSSALMRGRPVIRAGWVPDPSEVVVIEYDGQPLYEAIIKKALAENKPVPARALTDYRPVKNPYSPTMSIQERQLMIDRGKELMWVIGEYEALAKAGRAYPDHRVNRLFEVLRPRYLGAYQHYWECGIDFNGTRSVGEMFQEAKTRADKVIAIDALMHLQHVTGHILTAIYDFFTTGIPDKEITEIAKNAEREINRVLARLATNPRRNPSEYENMMGVIAEYVNLARARGAYPTHRINRLFLELKNRFKEAYSLNGWANTTPMPALRKTIMAAETRLDKVLAIDALMHTQHYNGHVITALYGFSLWDDDGHFNSLADKGERRIKSVLDDLFLSRKTNPLYHGGRDQGLTGTLKFGHYGRVNSGCDSGAIFVTPSQKYARQYVRDGGRLYEADVDLKKERIFDAANAVHLRKLEQLTNQETIRAITETISHGAGDWATMSQFLEEIQEAGFTGVKFLERPGENIEELPGGGFSVSGPPVYSYGFFHEIPVRAVQNPVNAGKCRKMLRSANPVVRKLGTIEEYTPYAHIVYEITRPDGSKYYNVNLYKTGRWLYGLNSLEEVTESIRGDRIFNLSRKPLGYLGNVPESLTGRVIGGGYSSYLRSVVVPKKRRRPHIFAHELAHAEQDGVSGEGQERVARLYEAMRNDPTYRGVDHFDLGAWAKEVDAWSRAASWLKGNGEWEKNGKHEAFFGLKSHSKALKLRLTDDYIREMVDRM